MGRQEVQPLLMLRTHVDPVARAVGFGRTKLDRRRRQDVAGIAARTESVGRGRFLGATM
jgi:hypothetical protein